MTSFRDRPHGCLPTSTLLHSLIVSPDPMNLSVARLSSLAVQRRGRHRVGASRLHPMSLRRHRPLQRLYGVAASATRVASIGSPRAAWARAMGAGGILGGAPGAGVVILCQEGGTASVASRRGGDCLRDPGRRDGDAVRRASARGECGTRRRGTVVTCFGKNGRRDSRRGDRRTGRGGGNAVVVIVDHHRTGGFPQVGL